MDLPDRVEGDLPDVALEVLRELLTGHNVDVRDTFYDFLVRSDTEGQFLRNIHKRMIAAVRANADARVTLEESAKKHERQALGGSDRDLFVLRVVHAWKSSKKVTGEGDLREDLKISEGYLRGIEGGRENDWERRVDGVDGLSDAAKRARYRILARSRCPTLMSSSSAGGASGGGGGGSESFNGDDGSSRPRFPPNAADAIKEYVDNNYDYKQLSLPPEFQDQFENATETVEFLTALCRGHNMKFQHLCREQPLCVQQQRPATGRTNLFMLAFCSFLDCSMPSCHTV